MRSQSVFQSILSGAVGGLVSGAIIGIIRLLKRGRRLTIKGPYIEAPARGIQLTLHAEWRWGEPVTLEFATIVFKNHGPYPARLPSELITLSATYRTHTFRLGDLPYREDKIIGAWMVERHKNRWRHHYSRDLPRKLKLREQWHFLKERYRDWSEIKKKNRTK